MFANVYFYFSAKKSHVHKYSQPLLNTLFMHLLQQLQPQVFLNMMAQAWHTYLWAVLPIPLYSTSQAPSGWMGSVGAQHFQISPEMFNRILGSRWATQGHSRSCPEATPLISWLCA